MSDVLRRRTANDGDRDSRSHQEVGAALDAGHSDLDGLAGESVKGTAELASAGELAQEKSRPASTSPSLLSTSLLSARSLVLLQLLSRIITFTLNQALLRFASPEVFGTAAIQFDLIGSTLLFLSREGVRGALLRGGPSTSALTSSADRQRALNLSLLPLPFFLALSSLLLPAYLYSTPTSTSNQPYFLASLALHFTSYLLELLSEPYHIQLQSDLNLKVRVHAEGAAVIVKAVVTLASIVLLGGERALLAFGIGQASYGLTILARFAAEYGGGRKALGMWVPKQVAGQTADVKQRPGPLSGYFSPHSYALAKAMTLQSVFKHFLTEGDRMIVSRISPLKDQGGYAIATNYGSLVARILFQPLEETSRLYFSRSSSPNQPPRTEPILSPLTPSPALLLLRTLLRQSLHLTLLLPTFLPPYLPHLLPLLLPSWPASSLRTPLAILLIYARAYLPLLSLNGFLEAYFSATAGAEDLARQSRVMLLGVAASLAALVGMRWMGGKGGGGNEEALVWSNCVNMGLRVGFVVRWVHGRARGAMRWRECLPRRSVWIAVGCAAVLVRTSERWFVTRSNGGMKALGVHVAVGGVCGVGCLGVIYLAERKAFKELGRALKGAASSQ